MQIHVIQEGEKFGPFSKPQLESFLWEGNVQRSDLAWYEGLEDWMPVWQVMGLDPLPGEVPEEELEPAPEPEAEAEAVAGPGAEEETVEAGLVVDETSRPEVEPAQDAETEASPVEEAAPEPAETEAVAAGETASATEEPAAPAPEARELPDASGKPRLVIPATLPKSLQRPPAIPRGASAGGGTPGLAAYSASGKSGLLAVLTDPKILLLAAVVLGGGGYLHWSNRPDEKPAETSPEQSPASVAQEGADDSPSEEEPESDAEADNEEADGETP